MTSSDSRQVVRDLVTGIAVGDGIEQDAQKWALQWIDSGADLFRIRPPDTPSIHLCAYAVLVDDVARSLLLADHVKAKAWLPPGGHVDVHEDPRLTVLREAAEELGITAEFHPVCAGGEPLFVTVTRTRGEYSHTDVSFWFALAGRQDMTLHRDPAEAHELRWFPIDDQAVWADAERFDPGMERFLTKLTGHLDASAPVSMP